MLLVFLLALVIGGHTSAKVELEQQHLTYNTEIEDDNLAIDKETFSSKLPVVNIDTGGKTVPGVPAPGQHVSQMKNSFVNAQVQIMDKEGTLHTLQDKPDVKSRARIRVRGNSSRYFKKKGYLLKLMDEKENDREEAIMGMEASDTWILHGPYLDKTLMRNYMWYNLSGQVMDWAPQAQFCEVFLNGEYQGVYVMVEQVSIGEGRIEMNEYDGKSENTSYIVCADRESVNDVAYLENFTVYTYRNNGKLEVKYPGKNKLTDELTEYISRDFSRFEKSLYSYDYDSRRYGYVRYIDVDSFVDYFIINEVTQNNDSGMFSTYFYKDVRGKLKMCVWDFNNCCDNYIEEQTSMAGFFMQNRTWFTMLLKDEAFTDRIISRYRELRGSLLGDENVKDYIQKVQNYLGAAIERNYQVWGDSFFPENDLLLGEESRKIGSYEEAVEQYEHRLISRLGWLDKNIEALRSYSHESVNKKFNH